MDPLLGLKENIILGKLIPAGTGIKKYDLELVKNKDDDDDLLKDILNELDEDSDNDLTTIDGEELTIHSIDEDDNLDA